MDKKNVVCSTGQVEDMRFVAYSYIRQGKYSIALPFFLALVFMQPDSLYDLQTLGALYLETGEAIKALKCFEKALKQEPDHAQTLLNRAKALFALGYHDQGIRLAKTLSSHPNEEIANISQALVLAHRGR